MVVHCFESDARELLARVHDRHPARIRLELAKGAQGKFRMARVLSGDRRHFPEWDLYSTGSYDELDYDELD